LAGTHEDASPLVNGSIIIPFQTPSFNNATAHVLLEDVSYADRDALLLAKSIIPNVNHNNNAGKDTLIPFTIHAAKNLEIDPRNDYAVRVWVDLDSDGRESSGDLFSDQRNPALTRGFGNQITIRILKR
jgi:hypothetical protein